MNKGHVSTSGSTNSIQLWHIFGLLLIASILVLVGYAYWPEATARSPEISVVDATRQVAEIEGTIVERVDFPIRVQSTGHLKAWRQAELSAQVQGVIVRRLVEEGQRVKAGDILIELDQRDLRIEFEEAKAEWLKIQAEYAVRFHNDLDVVAPDSNELVMARAEYLEAQKAHEKGNISSFELETKRRRFESMRIQNPEIRNAIQAANVGLTQAEQRLARAELALNRTRILAPFDGRIADISVEEGQRITPGKELLTILDDRKMKVDVDVLESDIVQVRAGASARIHVPALGDQYLSGVIHSVNPQIDPQNGTGRVTIAIPNPKDALLAGLFTYAYLETDRLMNTIVLPNEAVLVRQGRDLVFRIENNIAMWVYVDVGQRSGNYVEVTDGLSVGDTIAVAGHFALAHDTPVKVTRTVTGFEDVSVR